MIALIGRVLAWALGGAIGQLLVGAGLTMLVYVGVDAALEALIDEIEAAVGGMPADAIQIAMLMGFGDAISIIISALLTRAGLVAAGKVLGFRRAAS